MRNGNEKHAILDGLPVRDAVIDHTIKITPRDIGHGRRNVPASCPVARACCREFDATEALIYRTTAYMRNGKGWLRYMTPASVRTELIAFDRGGKMMPGDHVLKAPQGGQRLGVRHKPTGPKKRRGNKRRHWHLTEAVRERGPNLHGEG